MVIIYIEEKFIIDKLINGNFNNNRFFIYKKKFNKKLSLLIQSVNNLST